MRGIGPRKPLPAVNAPAPKETRDDCCRCLRTLPWMVAREVGIDEFPDLLIGVHNDGPICGACFDLMPHDMAGSVKFKFDYSE